MTIPDNPKAACEQYIKELETHYYPWYDTVASRHYYFWCILQGISMAAGVITSILACLLKSNQLDGLSIWRILLIGLPLLGAFASTLFVQIRIRQLLWLRERGRQAFQRLIECGIVKYASASTPSDYTTIHAWLVEQTAAIESEQTRKFFQIAPTQTDVVEGKTPPLFEED